MAIVTVSRELAALGDETAQEVAKFLGYRLVDKDALEKRIQSYGIKAKKFKKYDERKPSFFAALSQDRDEYLHYLRKAIFAEVEQGNCVLVGRGANIILKSIPALISLFMSARPEVRAERVKSHFRCDERRAWQIIERSDRDRIGFHRYFFDIDWKYPGNYHLSFNTGIFTPRDCAEIVSSLKDRVFTRGAEAQNVAILKNVTLEHAIKHRILYEQELPIRALEVAVSGNVVTLQGSANSQALMDSAGNLAGDVAGKGATIQNEIQMFR